MGESISDTRIDGFHCPRCPHGQKGAAFWETRYLCPEPRRTIPCREAGLRTEAQNPRPPHRPGGQGPGYQEKILSAAPYSPDGRYLAVNSDDGLLLWDLSAGKIVRQLKSHPDIIGHWIGFDAEGKYFAAVCNRYMIVWDFKKLISAGPAHKEERCLPGLSMHFSAPAPMARRRRRQNGASWFMETDELGIHPVIWTIRSQAFRLTSITTMQRRKW